MPETLDSDLDVVFRTDEGESLSIESHDTPKWVPYIAALCLSALAIPATLAAWLAMNGKELATGALGQPLLFASAILVLSVLVLIGWLHLLNERRISQHRVDSARQTVARMQREALRKRLEAHEDESGFPFAAQ